MTQFFQTVPQGDPRAVGRVVQPAGEVLRSLGFSHQNLEQRMQGIVAFEVGEEEFLTIVKQQARRRGMPDN